MDSNKSSSNNTILVAGIIVLLCCICLVVASVGGVFLYNYGRQWISDLGLPVPGGETATPPVVIQRPPSGEVSTETRDTLEKTVVPVNDPRQLACDLKDKCSIPETVPAPASPLTVGKTQKFWVSNVDTNENFQVDATLHYITSHVYFWVENGVDFKQEELQALADAFENKIYPTDREFFGSEWTPGVDNDPHIYILYVRGMGSSIAGYFSSADEMNPEAHPYSNAHEMFLFNADN
ncbi:MAG TPA: hypothetical protein VIV15_09845, partial [Anaerolineales bacterium]